MWSHTYIMQGMWLWWTVYIILYLKPYLHPGKWAIFFFLSPFVSILPVVSFQNVATFIFVVVCLTTFPLDVGRPDPLVSHCRQKCKKRPTGHLKKQVSANWPLFTYRVSVKLNVWILEYSPKTKPGKIKLTLSEIFHCV